MTIELWRSCLVQFQEHGTRNEQLMATILLQLMTVEHPEVEWIFDRFASEILEAAP